MLTSNGTRVDWLDRACYSGLCRLLQNEAFNPRYERDILVIVPFLSYFHRDSLPQRIQDPGPTHQPQLKASAASIIHPPPTPHNHKLKHTTMAPRILPLLAAILSLASTDAFSQPASELISNGRLGTSLFSTVARALPEGEYRAPLHVFDVNIICLEMKRILCKSCC